jgi:YD repeat-containing protein
MRQRHRAAFWRSGCGSSRSLCRAWWAEYQLGPRATRCVTLGLAALLTLFMALVDVTRAFADVTYVYDPAGRLVAVVDGSGNSATYTYDKVGNLTAISTSNGSTTQVFGFSPNNGPVGLQVTIYGDGFSTTPSQNTVTFNSGKNATVVSSTQTAIVTSVPSGATTGTVTVTSPNGTASGSFTVTAN